MIEIIPAILPETVADIRNKVAGILGSARTVQIDLVDGKFAPTQTWPYNGEDSHFFESLVSEEEGMPYWQEISYELDLMVKDAHQHLDFFFPFGPSRIVLHAEAEGDEKEFADFMEGIDPYIRDTIEIGIALNIDSSIDAYEHILKEADFVQCMGILHIGNQGEPFDEQVLEKIKELKTRFEGLPIAVDGGVSLENAKALVDAGATRLVVGSAIWKSGDPIETIQAFKRIGAGFEA
jgi:ribulose-phosphate 3-epimerase